MSPVGELEECLRHLDKAGFVSRVLETRSERHALGGIPAIFVCCRQARPTSRTEQKKSRLNDKFRNSRSQIVPEQCSMTRVASTGAEEATCRSPKNTSSSRGIVFALPRRWA